MKSLTILAACAILLCSCGGTAQTSPTSNPAPDQSAASATPKAAIIPIPDNIGLVMQCNKCVFIEEQGLRYIAGQLHNDAKQALNGYVMSVDLQDAQGKSVRKIPGLMLMSAIALQPGETKDFKDRVISTETNVTQAVVYLKKAGKDVKLSSPSTLKLNAPAATPTPTPAKKIVAPKR
jgi:hypothetical protein